MLTLESLCGKSSGISSVHHLLQLQLQYVQLSSRHQYIASHSTAFPARQFLQAPACAHCRSRRVAMPFPHSDNLYSAEESDHESFSEELSPTDGYFGRAQVSTNAMVPDPSIEDSKPEAKTLIPSHLLESMGRGSRISNHSSSLPSHSYAAAQSASTSVPSYPAYIPTSPVSSRRLDDLFPRRPASMNGPPPAYSPPPEPAFPSTQESSQPSQPSSRSQSSQPSPPSQASQLTPTTYNTFPERHLQRGYLPRREEPESMGNPEELPNESTPLSRDSRRRSSLCRDILRKLLLIALVLTVTTTLLATIFHGFKSVSHKVPCSVTSFPSCSPLMEIKRTFHHI